MGRLARLAPRAGGQPHRALFLQPTNRVQIKPEAQWEHARAEGCSANQFLAASVARTSFYQQMLQLFEQHDFLALPTAQV